MENDHRYLVLGRASLDLTPMPLGTAIEDAGTFAASLGGSAADIAVGLAKLGCSASLLTAVSDDPVGSWCLKQLGSYGVGTDLIARVGGQARNSLALTEARLEGHKTLIYRNNAADLAFGVQHLAGIDWSAFDTLVVTGTALAVEPTRTATLTAMTTARSAGLRIVLDIDYRPYSWSGPEVTRKTLSDAVGLCDIVVGNDEEWPLIATGTETGEQAAQAFALSAHGRIGVYKMGPEGSVTFRGDERIVCPAYLVEALKPVGSGDAFMAGLLASFDRDGDLPAALKRGAAAASITVTRPGCAPAMPHNDEIDAFLASRNAGENDAHSTS